MPVPHLYSPGVLFFPVYLYCLPMKRFVFVLIFALALCMADAGRGLAQLEQSSGKAQVNNTGTIVVRSTLKSTNNAKIENQGTIIVDGNAQIEQDTLKGRVEYVRDQDGFRQTVPQLTYENVYMTGRSEKVLNADVANRNFVAIDTLTTTVGTEIRLDDQYSIIANGRVQHDGLINLTKLTGRVVLNGDNAQPVGGTGEFKQLELNNNAGADVVRGGGFSVITSLELVRGELRNSTTNNFSLGDSALVVRSTQGSLAADPRFGKNVSVRYVGNGSIVSGPELPSDSTVLKTLRVENTKGLKLAKSVTVNDSLYLAASIDAEGNGNEHVITHASEDNPIYADAEAEVIGSLRRTNLVAGDKNIFNNVHTYALFPTLNDRGDVRNMTFRVLPNTAPLPDNNASKVRRSFTISAEDSAYKAVNDGFIATIGYGWKISPIDETTVANRDSLVWQRYDADSSDWYNAGSSEAPQFSLTWGYAFATNVERTGFFAIGPDGKSIKVPVLVYALLEGPYRNGSMTADLRERGFIPLMPPAVYPYDLDPNRQFIQVSAIPDSVVDWVVVEFRTQLSGGRRHYKTGFIQQDGRIVDYATSKPIYVDSGTYYVAVHHRNHLAIMTQDAYKFTPGVPSVLDMYRGGMLLGGSGAAKLVDMSMAGTQTFAMLAGDTNGDGKIDRDDYDGLVSSSWQQRNAEEYTNADTDLNSVVTTKDANVNWNNRGRATLVPK